MSADGATQTATPKARSGIWNRELDQYPTSGKRYLCLGIVILVTIVQYYEFYIPGAVAAGNHGILVQFHMSFLYYVNITVIGYIFGALASFLAGLADRFGRANIVIVGVFIVALICLVGIPNVHSKLAFAILIVAGGFVEGIVLVATPALIRDFSPQLGRASAMGFWTLGPVMGSLVVAVVVSNTSNSTPWQDQYIAAGVVGVIVTAIAAVGLKELSPSLRDQLMVSARDRALVEARAQGIDVEAALRKPFRQMLKPDIVGSAFAISVFLIVYYLAVGFFPIYFQTVFGFSQSKANALGNWNWAFNAGALVVVGYISDKVRVRKPFMLVGAIGAIIFTTMFALRTTHPNTSYSTFVVLLVLMSVSLGVAYAPWMASFTETVEKRNPALTATGLAVWGLIIRLVIAVTVFIGPHIVNTVTTLVESGPTATSLAAQYSSQVATAQKLDPATAAALGKNPADQAAGIKAISELTGISVSDVTTVATVAATHASSLAAIAKVDPATQAALAKNPADQAAGIKAISEITGISAADVTTAAVASATHGPALAAAAKIDPTTLAALAANPTDQAAGIKAISDLTGVAVAEVTTIATLNATHGPAIAAGQAIDKDTATTLVTDPTNQAALTKAVGEIVTSLHITAAEAETRIADLKTIPVPQLELLQTSGTQVVAAEATLKDLASIPPTTLALLQKDGAAITAATAALKDVATIPPAQLATVAADGTKVSAAKAQLVALGSVPPSVFPLLTKVQAAAAASPKQWRNYFWIAVGGQIVFIPLIFLLVGFWDPRKAKKAEQEHEAMVDAELAKLAQGDPTPAA